MKTLTILSGKGGVGKSTLAASIAVILGKDNKIVAVDCDVDAPNLALVMGLKDQDFDSWERIRTNEKAYLVPEKCKGLKDCVNACNFSAISWDQEQGLPEINEFLCVGCGACIVACPENAINFKKVENAKVGVGYTDYGFPIVTGHLDIGESGSGKVVNAVKDKADEVARDIQADIMLIDSAAGIGCPVIASIRGSDYVLVVTEPTPVAFSDLKRALEIVDHFDIPASIVINRWDINEDFTSSIEDFSKSNKIPVLGRIPYDKRFVDSLVNLKPVVVYEPGLEKIFTEILDNILV
ncbi:MAG: ATP-binding protein [Methanomicrobiales archaeon]